MRALLTLFLFTCLPALGCDYPDEGNMPLRRALTRVQMLPETGAWERAEREAGRLVTYELSLRETMRKDRRCYWTVQALSAGKPWRRFYVTPDGTRLLSETGDPLRPATR